MAGAIVSDAMKKLPETVRLSLVNSKAEYRRMGNSGLRVSLPILGAMSYGRKDFFDWMIEADEAMPLLKAAYDRGLNTWDTSNNYSNGYSEKIIGQAIKKYQIPRQKVVICTKCFGLVSEDPSVFTSVVMKEMMQGKDYVNQRGLSRQAIFNAVNGSLERLETDYIDLLQIHRFDNETPIEETMKALHDLVQSGKVRYIGASSMWTYQFVMLQELAERKGWTKFISMQNHYSLLYREEERDMIKYCKLTGVGLMPWSPLCRGHLARPVSSRAESIRGAGEDKVAMFKCGVGQPDETIIDRVEEIAKKKDWTMSQVALAWINKRVTSPIVGISNIKRMDEAIETRDKVLTDEEENYLEEVYTPKPIIGHL